ncbi:MAG: YkgJ family cysteine cluster protein [Thermodesulfobacteriota bacterium]
MDIDFTPYFEKYEALANKADAVFQRIQAAHPDLVLCEPKCTDCCYALFDLTLVEALYLNYHFKNHFSGQAMEAMLEKANRADRKIYKLKKQAYDATKEGRDEGEVVEEMAKERVRCPLLNDNNLCDLYPHRPIACRVYGVPLSIGGQGRTCGHSGFAPGESYPTVNMDTIHDQLLSISAEFVRSIGSKHVKMGDVLVPVSMALLTTYDEEYLGISAGTKDAEADAEGAANE